MLLRTVLRPLIFAAALLVLGGVLLFWLLWSDRGDPSLRPFVHAVPPVPIVFTSRSEPASFVAAAPDQAVYTFPGQIPWKARQGRLRLLTPGGAVHELTWNRPLPDGSTLIDVMSPSVSPDGTRILFAGRKGGSDPGHFRLYEIGVDGQGLRQLTGGPDDPGCSAVPPLRHGEEGETLPDEQRRQIDYDDIDPVHVPGERIAFVSSRHPDLGRFHARRATNVWVMNATSSERFSITANRNNDRWPWLLRNGNLLFSLWSRNTERLTLDRRDIRPDDAGGKWASASTDAWLGAFVEPWGGGRLGNLVKPPEPVWRPRLLFNGKVAYMTSSLRGADLDRADVTFLASLEVAQVAPGLIANAPSAVALGSSLPALAPGWRQAGPTADAQGRKMSWATPSPCPDAGVVLSGAAWSPEQAGPEPGDFGIHLLEEDWDVSRIKEMLLLFDDPEYVDAEPVAVYPRMLDRAWVGRSPPVVDQGPLPLALGKTYTGKTAEVEGAFLYPGVLANNPGQNTDIGEGPVFDAPAAGSISEIRVFASYRDRFDDAKTLRSPGGWELLLSVAAHPGAGHFKTRMPPGIPTVLAGFDKEGKVVQWTTRPRDSTGKQATFFALAGDHYSGAFAGVHQLCLGCHPGHSGLEYHDYPERRR